MKKTIFALLLVLALVITVSAFAVSAAEVTKPVAPAQLWSNLTTDADGKTTGYCPHCDQTVEWTGITTNKDSSKAVDFEESGHYFLDGDTYGIIQPKCTGKDMVLHLNGNRHKRWTSGNNPTGAIRFGSNCNIFILDNEAGTGSVDGDQGWAISCYGKTANITLYSGTITTNRLGSVAATSSTTSNGSYSNGKNNGGNGGTIRIANSGSFTMFGGTVNGTKAYNGGAIYATGSSTVVHIVGGTINGGNAVRFGGAIATENAKCYIWGGTINAGKADGNSSVSGYGGALATGTESSLIEVHGGTIDATNGSSDAGKAIGVCEGEVVLKGGKIIGSASNTLYVYNHASAKLTIDGVTLEGTGGENNTDPFKDPRVGISGLPEDTKATITLGAYTGNLHLDPYTSGDSAANYPVGLTFPMVTLAENFDTTKQIYCHDGDKNMRPLTINADNKLVITEITGVKADGTEESVLELEGDYAYFTVAEDGLYNLRADAAVELGGKALRFNTNGKKLSVLDAATDDLSTAGAEFTVSDPEDLEPVATNPANNYRYLVTATEDGTYTANRISVNLDKASLKTNRASLYYTTSVKSNALGAQKVAQYGVAFSLLNPVGDDFHMENVYNANGILYTVNDYTPVADTAMNETAVSALVEDVLVAGATDNADRAELPIYANAYAKVKLFNGHEAYLMADKDIDLTYREIIEKLDTQLGETPEKFVGKETIIANFYNTWTDPMAAWELPSIKNLIAG